MQLATNPLAMVLAHTILWPSVILCTTDGTVSTGVSLHVHCAGAVKVPK